jgi:hypothetical protein
MPGEAIGIGNDGDRIAGQRGIGEDVDEGEGYGGRRWRRPG